jgi:hypothetical protein
VSTIDYGDYLCRRHLALPADWRPSGALWGRCRDEEELVIHSQSSASRAILVECAITAYKHRLLERDPTIQRNAPRGDNRNRRGRCCSDYRVDRGYPKSKLIGRPESSRHSVVGSAQPGRSCALA